MAAILSRAVTAVFLFVVLSGAAVDDPAPAQTGAFSRTHLAAAVLGDRSSRYEHLFEAGEEITWQYFVPPDYDPERPAGLLVYISPTRSGAMPKEWRNVMNEHNIIWVGADQSGNRTRVPRRVLLSLLGVELAKQDYEIDRRRVYLSGFSGGGRVASMAVIDNADTFSGGLFFCGADLWHLEESPNAELMKRNRYVLITGTGDQALEPVKKTYRGYRRAGIDQTKLMIIRNMGHNTPRRGDFAKAIRFLEEARDPVAAD